jgi:hypothetical protein
MWYEELPEECPPLEAFSPNEVELYRLAKSNPPTEADFFFTT